MIVDQPGYESEDRFSIFDDGLADLEFVRCHDAL